MSSMLSQRWGFRQHSWRHPADGGFDPAAFDVVPLPEATARGFVTRHHYAASFPAARYSYGLTTTDERLAVDGTTVDGRALVGVAVLTNVFPDLEPNTETLELGRLVLTDTPANAEHLPDRADGREGMALCSDGRHHSLRVHRGLPNVAGPQTTDARAGRSRPSRQARERGLIVRATLDRRLRLSDALGKWNAAPHSSIR